ncbi:hypothetical protein SESBI_09035 [Sesbania bispinosa]|nr:hypothetical protein SESBI_09035 [Sesbania bispinosa]
MGLGSKANKLWRMNQCLSVQVARSLDSFKQRKHCVQSYNVFDFLRDIVSRVPDYGHGHGHGHSEAGADDRALPKRRKAAGDDCNDSDEEAKRKRETFHQQVESEPCTSVQQSSKDVPITSVAVDNGPESKELSKENTAVTEESAQSLRNIDLNANLNENEDKNACTAAQASLPEPATTEIKHEEIPGWSLSDVDKMAIDTMQLANLGSRLEEDEEDYDEEG